jgi:hypothetical protein
MKVNIRFSIEEMAQRRALAGSADQELHVRASGRSTGAALSAIGLAMMEGGQGILFDIPVDHFLKPIAPSATREVLYSFADREAQDRQLLLMQDLVDKLGLKGFTFNKVSRTYRYQVIYEV